jgi:hypothetical protein
MLAWRAPFWPSFFAAIGFMQLSGLKQANWMGKKGLFYNAIAWELNKG